jgi:hypothetical protein
MTGLSRLGAPAGRSLSPNQSDSGGIIRGSRFALKKLAGIGVLAIILFAEGCLVPQSVDPTTTRPHTVPRVDLISLPRYLLAPFVPLDPQGPADVIANPACQCRLDVTSLIMIVDDPTVDVDVRVFVDYDLNVPQSQLPVLTLHRAGDFNSSETARPVGTISLDNARLGGPGTHVVELVLGETAGFLPDDAVPPPFPPHRQMRPDFESSTFKFVVQVSHDPARQSCSDSPPPPSEAQVKSCP